MVFWIQCWCLSMYWNNSTILNDPEWQSGTNGSKITFTLMVAYFAKNIYWSFWLPLFGGKGYFAANGKNGYIAMKIKVLHAKILCARCVHVKLCTVEEIWTLECTYICRYIHINKVINWSNTSKHLLKTEHFSVAKYLILLWSR